MGKTRAGVLMAVPLLFRHRVAKGVDWGVERLVLARVNGKELWWTRGQRVWSGRFTGGTYEPASMRLIAEPDTSYRHDIEFKSARRSKKFFQENAARINEFFGCDVASMLRSDLTIISEGEWIAEGLSDYEAWEMGPIPCLPTP